MGDKTVKKTQTSEILSFLQTHEFITQSIAHDKFGAERLAVIVSTLRKRGYDISTTMVTKKNRFGTTSNYAEYRLIG